MKWTTKLPDREGLWKCRVDGKTADPSPGNEGVLRIKMIGGEFYVSDPDDETRSVELDYYLAACAADKLTVTWSDEPIPEPEVFPT